MTALRGPLESGAPWAEVPSMAGKSVLVTGGTGGIGQATAIGLATLGARVGITDRDQARVVTAADGIRAATGNAAVDVFAADMSVQAEVRRLAAQVADTYPRLDVLVNNVGGFWAHRHVTADGLEHTFALNHVAPFLLTNLLLDCMTTGWPPTGCPSSPAGPPGGSCKDETTYDAPGPRQAAAPAEDHWNRLSGFGPRLSSGLVGRHGRPRSRGIGGRAARVGGD
jgi:NAD(P)-dependent dehydrogenase (short-subunit alcohol dehydrogenase family)